MKRKEVKIIGLSYSQTQIGSFVVVLSEIKGNKKIPIIIKPNEAQFIVIKIEDIKTPRPLTHHLFKKLTDSFNIDVQEIYIYSIVEGIFYTKIVASNGLDTFEIDCSVGDGISLSLVYDCPIYVSDDVIDITGIIMNDDGTIPTYTNDKYNNKYDDELSKNRTISVEDLERMMKDAIANEEYEIAAEIRDRIQKIKEKRV
jgi:bifunctional DNase/RNase